MRPILLLTRPAPAARRFARDLGAEAAGFEVIVSPLQEIVALPAEIPPAPEVILTSEAAVGPFVARSPAAGRRAWCVGGRTARAAEAAGFAVTVGPGDGAGLAQAILDSGADGPFVHARGRHVAADVAQMLRAAGRVADEAVVYDQVALPLADDACAALAGAVPVLVPLFSPRSAALFVTAAAGAVAPVHLVAISAAVARAAAPLGLPVERAAAPDGAAMLAACRNAMAALVSPASGIGAPE
ncbi:uroporphyrinogen-III synthase [Phaeovulum vinaykumarii]|uniref:Uroporphyrinogen-III synthase n=1 Tax=Phaeovulum vinaykumarii TaxID=407234 RepID=A0A1N7MAD4_9RHOB|nr:uroporphyrinogen-III synthase [Phaeovulum vinaykumarii]SIS82939.1 uroporphyrinogen-III synthase [Phaeovulum vinaykumarii]SOC10541.1 uroporphyrinogen-III synthase [Phaeovulum vinaykumarii]